MPRTKTKAADRHLEFHPNGSTYFRISIPTDRGPQNIRKTLGVIDRPMARRVRDALVHTLNGARAAQAVGIDLPHNALADHYGVGAMLRKIGIIRRNADLATIAQLIDAWHEDAPGRSKLSARHAKNAPWALLKILRTVHPGKTVEQFSTAILTAELLEDYQAARARAAQTLGPRQQESARITTASMVNQARSVVSDLALRQSHMRALTLPDLTKFKNWKRTGSTRRIHEELDDATMARLATLIDDLWFNDPAAWLALSMAANIGLRRSEATRARWAWVRFIRDIPTIYLVRTDTDQPKGNERKLEIPLNLWQDMLEHRTTSEYILPGDTLKTRDAIFKRTTVMLHSAGIDAIKPNHELRAVQLRSVRDLHGSAAAQLSGGHSDQRTTEIYTGKGTGKTVRTF